ncbi:hypothetical protein PHYSODRAFT_493891 [Phytophthora sojae]|uniref:DUF7869 domain-containing protein n=1 Tax=Phytophthora sojae (strain P6497) TaxID=1094619 RepID=G4Z447_PHYSP|nr:hypothetical protein PHYSODRAFT_493891 [Phytophthora sojae]EGZ22241.1 hypothetical protein PHYSODRAFT_493891 [Phytophthora sojae]|eukprot:XP_009524958.1 hypothetical protein PHYSODRAFT_493891 [Phytophthora sojae]
MHLSEAIAQRRFVSTFIRNYSALHAPEQYLPRDIIPDTSDDNDAAEDHGGGISMPYFGHSRPSIDDYNSNLILQNFVVADISHNVNHVFLYDERAQGKDANALCSLRLLLDNCVGQNKSKAVLMFFSMLSIVFPYRKVVLCFLLPVHSHNVADRVVAWCRKTTQDLNLYTPSDLLKEVNNVKGVSGVFFDHNDPKRPFFVGWNDLLSKYFLPPPSGYTANYLFEIDQGICTARKTVDSPDSESISFAMMSTDNVDSIRKAVLAELFGPAVTSIFQASIASVQLRRHRSKSCRRKK